MKERIISLLLIFAFIGTFITNEPVNGDEGVLVYTSVANKGNNNINDIKFSYAIFDLDGYLHDFTSVDGLNVNSGAEKGKLSRLDLPSSSGEYLIMMTANSATDNNFRQVIYRPIIIES